MNVVDFLVTTKTTKLVCDGRSYYISTDLFKSCLIPPKDDTVISSLRLLKILVDGLIRVSTNDTELNDKDLFTEANQDTQLKALMLAIEYQSFDLITMWIHVYEDFDGLLYDYLVNIKASTLLWAVATPREYYYSAYNKQLDNFEKWLEKNKTKITPSLFEKLKLLSLDESSDFELSDSDESASSDGEQNDSNDTDPCDDFNLVKIKNKYYIVFDNRRRIGINHNTYGAIDEFMI